jgi:hypothetical protein
MDQLPLFPSTSAPGASRLSAGPAPAPAVAPCAECEGGVGPDSVLGQCMHCISALHHGSEAMWWCTWRPGQR